ncbi:sugar epimerase [Polaribacter sp.]|nr:sugar epimerase [Polaribacter sp.]
MQKPVLINGGCFSDARGTLLYNNDFDASVVKRIYTIENSSLNFIRGWQGHRIEQRWFSVVYGAFNIQLIAIDNWQSPSRNLQIHEFKVSASSMDVLHVPAGYISSIQAVQENSKLVAMSDYLLGSIQDEYKYDINYFNDKN